MKLYRSFVTVGSLTMVSRVLGFIRDILIAAALGSGAVADAFFVAFRFPNLFRRLFGEGAFNAAFVPLFAKRLEGEGEDAAKSYAREALSGLFALLLVFSTVAMLAMPWLMAALAPGFLENPSKYNLSVALTQIAFPYLLCLSLVALLSGVLNSLHRYWAAAAAPILLNVVLIAAITLAIWMGFSRRPEAGYVLAWGVCLAGAVQLVAVWLALERTGMKLRIGWPRWTPDMKRLVMLGIPGLLAGGITQINIVIGTIIASLQAGAVSWLYYADRLYQLPLGIVGVAVGVVLLPELSRNLRAGDRAAAMDSQNRSLEFALLLTLPAAVALALISKPIIQVLFERGAFNAGDTAATAAALTAFAVGLPSFVLIKVFQPAFFAREDTKTPMYFSGVNMLINVIGSLVLFFMFQAMGLSPHIGIALATSIAGWVNTVMLWRALTHNGDFEADARLLRNLPLIALASGVMGLVLLLLIPLLEPLFRNGTGLVAQIAGLGGLTLAGLLTFGLVALLTGVLSRAQLIRFLRRT